MSDNDDPQGLANLRDFQNTGSEPDTEEDSSQEPKNQGSKATEDDLGTQKPKNQGSETADNDLGTRELSNNDGSTESSSDSTSSDGGQRPESSRPASAEDSSPAPRRKAKAFMLAPGEERRFKHLVADVEALVRQRGSSSSVQNSQVVRALIEMAVDDLEDGDDRVVDYVMDQMQMQ